MVEFSPCRGENERASINCHTIKYNGILRLLRRGWVIFPEYCAQTQCFTLNAPKPGYWAAAPSSSSMRPIIPSTQAALP